MQETNSTYPLPVITSFVSGHAPQADAVKYHPQRILKGWLPHMHVVAEDMEFDDKQALGKHMELYHAPELTIDLADHE